jgi:hypothetical protein
MTHRFFAALSVLVCATANAKTIEGQVFIVTAGGPAIKLALVQVGAIPSAVIEKYLADVEPKINAERRDAESAAVEAQKAKTAAEAITKKLKVSDKYLDTRAYAAWRRQVDSAFQNAIFATKRFYEAEAHKKNWCSAAPYFMALPQPIGTAKTDVDGRFQMNLPDDGDYILVAKAERTVFEAVEKYYWVVRLRQGETKVTLSNDNLTVSGSPDSLLTTKE